MLSSTSPSKNFPADTVINAYIYILSVFVRLDRAYKLFVDNRGLGFAMQTSDTGSKYLSARAFAKVRMSEI